MGNTFSTVIEILKRTVGTVGAIILFPVMCVCFLLIDHFHPEYFEEND